MPVEDIKAQQIILGSLYDYFAELSEPCAASHALKNRHRALIECAVNKLSADSVRVALAGNDGAEYLISFLKKNDKSVFTVDMDYELPDDVTDIKKLAIQIARNVREKNRMLCAYIAVANAEGTKTYKLISESGETPKELLRTCADKLLLILCDYERIASFVEESEEEKAADKSFKDILGIAASVIVLAASIAGFITALILR